MTAIMNAVALALQECKDPYAKAYLAEVEAAALAWGAEGVVSQLTYALCNMAYWRGDNARICKAAFRAFIKAHQ